MKVLQVTPRYPPRTGGVETHVKEISEGLVRRGHEVTVVTADARPDVPRRETRNGVAIHRCRGVAPGGAFHVAPGVFRRVVVEGTSADVVHAHNYHSLPMLFVTLAVTDQSLVLTPHYHGQSESSIRNALLTPYQRVWRWMLRRADRVTAVSDWEADRLASTFGVSPIVVPNGVDIERFRNATPEIRDGPYLLSVGRLEEYKGVQYAVMALSYLPTHELLVAGTGPYEDELRRIAAKCGVKERVHFLGFVPDERLPQLYAGAEVSLHLSDIEAYGLTVAEALASGTPCVVSVKNGLAHWTDREDVVGVEAFESNRIAEAISDAAGRKPSADGLPSWEDVVEETLSVYRSTLKGGPNAESPLKKKLYHVLFTLS